jgi:hypothetical protein
LLHHCKIVVAILVVLVSLLPAAALATPLAQQGNFKVSVAGTAAGSVPHEIALKMTQIPGGQLSETTGFSIKPESVMQVKQGENLMVTTSENLKFNNVKAKNVQGQQVNLLPLPNNIWSLQNLVPGVYLLDVIVDMSSSGILGIYETVLVILQPDQTPLPPSTVINQLSIFIENGFGSDDNDTRPPPPDQNITTPEPEPIPGPGPPPNETDPIICPLNAEGIEVCPPTDEPSPVPEPPPECPEAGPEICGEETPPPDEELPDSDADADDGNGNGDAGGDGSGGDGSNGNGNDGDDGSIAPVPPFG